jgi:hypothetical protein
MSSNVVDGNFMALDVDRDLLTGLDRWVSGEDVVKGIREMFRPNSALINFAT